MAICLIRGAGDVGSAVAHILFAQGYDVFVHDSPSPAHLRRGMSFVDAFFSGTAQLERVMGKRARDIKDLLPMAKCRRAIPVITGEINQVLRGIEPAVVIDARMRKRMVPDNERLSNRITIGLGPNFVAGGNVDFAIETAWGDDLGKVIKQGATKKLAGEPRPIDGAGRERNVYAFRAGEFRTAHVIGQRVRQGEVVGVLDEHFVTAPLAGCIRGLTHHGVRVESGAKIVEIDPRGDPATCFGLGERPQRIASGVLTAVRMEHGNGQ